MIDFYELGRRAEASGKTISPILNAEIRNFIADRPVGDPATKQAMKDYIRGWTHSKLNRREDTTT